MIRHLQRIIQLNPFTREVIVTYTHRLVPHTDSTLKAHAAQYGNEDETSINGRTKAGWINFIEYVGTTDIESSVDTDAE